MNPLADNAAAHSYSPVLGAASPAAKIVSMFTRYAVRSCKMTYNPSRGYQETGTYGMVFRPDVEVTLDTFAEIKNTDNFHDFSVNKATSKVFISSDLRKPASYLYFVDETKITDKDRAYQGYIQGCSQDLQASTDLTMGDLVFELVIDCYALQGDNNPATAILQTLVAYSGDNAPRVAEAYMKFLTELKPLISKNLITDNLKSYVANLNFEKKESRRVETTQSDTYMKNYVMVDQSEVKESKEEKKTKNDRSSRQ